MWEFLKNLNEYAALINLTIFLAFIGLARWYVKWHIDVLKQQNDVVKERLDKALSESPLAIAEDLKKRYELTEEEYKRFKQEMEKKRKEDYLLISYALDEIHGLKEHIDKGRGLVEDMAKGRREAVATLVAIDADLDRATDDLEQAAARDLETD